MAYSIEFQLLLPKALLLRLDFFPFLLAYLAESYSLYQFYDNQDINLYLRLALIGTAFLHCLTYIMGHWSKKLRAFIQFKTLKGNIQANLENASHILISQSRDNQPTVYGITDLYKQELENGRNLFIFHFEQRKFYFDQKQKRFTRLKPKIENELIGKVICSSFLEKEEKEFYENNILEIPIRPFWSIFRDQVMDPFVFFQFFSGFLWLMDENKMLSVFIIIMILSSTFFFSVQRIKTLVGYRSMTLAPHQVHILDHGKWVEKSSYDILPGDIIAVQPGYHHKKSKFDMISDADFLKQEIPFFSALGNRINKANPNDLNTNKKEDDNNSFKNVPCDILLIGGSCVVNEAILTGEAVPQIKESVSAADTSKKFHESHQKGSIIYCGTEILQINEQYNDQDLNQLMRESQIKEAIPKPPSKCCIGLVLKTGFDTSKGKLIRRVIAHAENPKMEQKDGLWIILFLLICSIVTAVYVLLQGLEDQDRSKQKLFLRCILILTTVVPPELPMILNIAVNNSIVFLQKKKIFVSEPKKIPLGGRVSTVAFDKTGTLTQDKFIFEGIVDNCFEYKSLKNFNNCQNQNNVILAGCHSLINIDRELTGDPIQLMFFNQTKWQYSSKNKEAKKVLEKVIIEKVYPFKAELKRMCVVAQHVSGSGVRKMKALVKGAPQALQKLLEHVPEKYREAYSHYTKQGYRLLALASKEIDYQHFKTINNKDKEREYCEKGLVFGGFFICNSPLKEDTAKHIQHLQSAKYNVLIITGDNVLTAANVGLTIKLGQSVWMIQKNEHSITIQQENGTKVEVSSLKDLQHRVSERDGVILATSTSKDIPHDYYPYINIFARASPHDKEVIVKYFKEKQGGIVYAGDGTNDVGGLRNADVGVAVVGTTNISEVIKKQEVKKKEEQDFQKRLNEVKNDLGMGIGKKVQLINQLTQQRIRRRTQEGGPAGLDDEIKFGDACIAAPFTSKHSNSIKCVLIIIRQAIATLVTTIQTYKILAISSMLQAYALAEMNMNNLKYSEKQSMVLGILASINFYFFSNPKPLKKLSDIRAPYTIFTPWFAISFFGQIIIFLGVNYYALNQIGLTYVLQQDKELSADQQFQKSFINTVITLFSAISQSVIFIVNHGGEPHMESLFKNSKYFKFLFIPLIACFILTANIFPDLSEFLDLKFEGIPYEANIKMLGAFGFLTVSTYILDRLCRFGQFKRIVGWF